MNIVSPLFSFLSLHLDVVSHATSRYSTTYDVPDLNIEYAQPESVVIIRLSRYRIVISDRHKLLSRESFRQTFEWNRRRLTADFKASLFSSNLGGCEHFGWRLSSMFWNFSLKRKRELDARFERFSDINFNCLGIFEIDEKRGRARRLKLLRRKISSNLLIHGSNVGAWVNIRSTKKFR